MKYVKLIWSNLRPWVFPSLFHLPLLAFLYIILIDIRALLSPPDRSETPARLILDWVARLPTSPLFYLAIAALLGTYFGWRWVLSARLHRELTEQEKENVNRNLISDDWLAIRGLRRRAFTLRTQAGVILTGVIAFLLAGVYVVFFILPQLLDSDRVLVEEVRFQQNFGRTLQLISEGRYWLRVSDASSAGLRDLSLTTQRSHDSGHRHGIFLSDYFSNLLFGLFSLHIHRSDGEGHFVLWLKANNASRTGNDGQRWEAIESLRLKENEWLATAEFSPDGRHGIVAGDKGSVFLTNNGGETWKAVESLGLKENEWIVTANLSPDGRHGILAGDKGFISLVSLKDDNENKWEAVEDLGLKVNEWIVTANVSPDGRHGILAGDKGSVFLISLKDDGLLTWETVRRLRLKENEWIVAASIVDPSPDPRSRVITVLGNLGSVFVRVGEIPVWGTGREVYEDLRRGEWISTTDMAGQFGLAGGTNGSVFRTDDWGQSWNKVNDLPFPSNTQITSVSLSGDGKFGVIGNRRGEVAVTSDGGLIWRYSANLRFEQGRGEYLVAASLDFDGGHGVAGGNTGTMFVTSDSGLTWNRIDSADLPRRRHDVHTNVYDSEREHGVVVGKKNMAFMTLNGGKTWRAAEGVVLTEGEDLSSSAFSDNGQVGVVGGDLGSVFSTNDSGKTWSQPRGVDVKPNARIVTSALSSDGQVGVLADGEGSLLVTKNGGSNWFRSEDIEFIENESVYSIFLLEGTTDDGAMHAVVVGNEGSVFATRDGGTSWFLAEPNLRGVSFRQGFSKDGYIGMVDDRRRIYILKPYPELAGLRRQSLFEIRNALGRADRILRTSTIGQEMTSSLNVGTGDLDAPSGSSDNGSFEHRYISELTLLRIVSLTLLFFLVQLLVRTYRYNLRLAAFWDSRADAVLVSSTFSNRRTVKFNRLVAALAPDEYDFKPSSTPGTVPLDWLRSRLKS